MDTKAYASTTLHKTIAKRLDTLDTEMQWPASIDLQMPTTVDSIPKGNQWLHELKIDGYRTLATIKDKKASFINRAGQDWTELYPHLKIELFKLGVVSAIFDGQIILLDKKGHGNLRELQLAIKNSATQNAIFFVFDLLYLNGQDLRSLSLEERKLRLKQLLKKSTSKHIFFSEHSRGSGEELFQKACEQGFNGIVSKNRFHSYKPGRNQSWQIFTDNKQRDFLVIGYTQKLGRGKGTLDEILLGAYDGKKLVYVGKIKANFDKESLKRISEFVQSHIQTDNPLKKTKLSGLSKINWVQPHLVIEINYHGWTPQGRLRSASFYTLRDDKPAAFVEIK